jgi:hypothetical protein
MKASSLLQATFVWPLFKPSSAALSLASKPFFCVPVSDELLTLVIRFWMTACGESTVTVKLHEDVFPDASVTAWVTVVVPIGKTEPLAKPAVRVVVAPVQLSVPTGAV